jgi:hypothetical protein
MPLALQRALQVTSVMKGNIAPVFLLLVALVSPAYAETESPVQELADHFLALANAGYQAVYRVNSEAQWAAATDVTPEHDAAAEATCEDISTRAMMEYFKPLMSWLEEQNKGREIGWD